MSTVNSSENIPSNQKLNTQDVSILDTSEPLLPRSAWNTQVAFLRAMFRAKKALDKIDRESNTNSQK
ncbi:MAG: hypothetical protein F6K23_33395 [Okeania sp. SIO2C9]|uniref:hypothetical protein n=1 Tax=Okeania sp. SIO2C9 TaxID=2607791 RepID=UPI0013C11B1F|nr:hypothetical protein [Okeania sp. SIO2C9]NEQ77476.1 hypothetical protein [Okeania sp. SIO2C9]